MKLHEAILDMYLLSTQENIIQQKMGNLKVFLKFFLATGISIVVIIHKAKNWLIFLPSCEKQNYI